MPVSLGVHPEEFLRDCFNSFFRVQLFFQATVKQGGDG